jgi:hypothetical protein
MSDLIERLRSFPDNVLEGAPLCHEAADEIERLRRLAENWHGDLTVREQQVERLERELAEAREVIKLGVAAATGKDVLWVDALERMDAFLRSAADQPSDATWRCECGDVQPVGVDCQCGRTSTVKSSPG